VRVNIALLSMPVFAAMVWLMRGSEVDAAGRRRRLRGRSDGRAGGCTAPNSRLHSRHLVRAGHADLATLGALSARLLRW
jgi:hypothetical protein